MKLKWRTIREKGSAGIVGLAVAGVFIAVVVFVLLVPTMMDMQTRMSLSEALSVLRENGYVAYGAPTGDWTTLGDLYTEDIYPQADSTHDIGATGNEYRVVYADSIVSSNITMPTGRGATYIGATSVDSPAIWQAQADFIMDGTADQTEINTYAALGNVILAPGTYTTSGNIETSYNLSGAGWTTIINCDGAGLTKGIDVVADNVTLKDFKLVITAGAGTGGARPNAINPNGYDGLVFDHLWLVGDETVGDDGSSARQNGIMLQTGTGSTVKYCTIEDFNSGIKFWDYTNSNVVCCVVDSCWTNGISESGTSDYITVTGATRITDATVKGIELGGVGHDINGVTITGGCTIAGIHIVSPDDCSVTGVVVDTVSGHGIYLQVDVGGVNTITGCTVTDAGTDGIHLCGVRNNTVTGNSCYSCGNSGIDLNNTAHNNVVTGNTCWGNTWHGIFADLESDHSVISGNRCRANGIDGIRVYRSYNLVVSGNNCQGNTGDGIHIEGDGTRDANSCVITGNFSQANTGDDIELVGGTDCVENIVELNKITELVDGGSNTKVPTVYVPISNPNSTVGDHPALNLPDAADTTANISLYIPNRFNVLLDAHVIIVCDAGAGNLYWNVATDWGRLGTAEDYNAGSDAIAPNALAIVQDDLNMIPVTDALTGISSLDMVGMAFIREGTNVLDTVNQACSLIGLRMRYQ